MSQSPNVSWLGLCGTKERLVGISKLCVIFRMRFESST